MKKIIFLNYTADISGSSVALKRLIEAVQDNYLVTIVTTRGSYLDKEAQKFEWTVKHYDVPLVKNTFRPWAWIDYFIRLKKLEKNVTNLYHRQKADLLFINCLPNFGSGFLNPRGVTLLWWVHELELNPPRVLNRMIKSVQKTAAGICCVSTPVLNLFGKKAHLLPNGLNSPQTVNIVNPLGGKKLQLIWVGTVSPRKGLHRLAEIVPPLKKGWSEIHLEVFGSCTEKYTEYYDSSINRIEEKGMSVIRHDNIHDEKIPWSSSKVLLLTSTLAESFSLPVLEAMSHGMLVVSSNNGGVTDFGRHSQNLIFYEELESTLVDTLINLRDQPERLERMQHNATQKGAQYSYARVCDAFNRVIESVLPVNN